MITRSVTIIDLTPPHFSHYVINLSGLTDLLIQKIYLEKQSPFFISHVLLLSPQFRYGRKPVFFITMAVQAVFTVVLIFSPSWIAFAIIIFISSMGQMANYMAAFVLGTHTFYTSDDTQQYLLISMYYFL